MDAMTSTIVRGVAGQRASHGVGGIDEDRVSEIAHGLDGVDHSSERDGEHDELGIVRGSIEWHGGEVERIERGRDLVALRVAGGEPHVMAEITELPGQVGAHDAGADDGDRDGHAPLRGRTCR